MGGLTLCKDTILHYQGFVHIHFKLFVLSNILFLLLFNPLKERPRG